MELMKEANEASATAQESRREGMGGNRGDDGEQGEEERREQGKKRLREDKLGETDEGLWIGNILGLALYNPRSQNIVLGITDLDPTVQSKFRSVAGSARRTVRNTSMK